MPRGGGGGGARPISTLSLITLAKHPASTVQILGGEGAVPSAEDEARDAQVRVDLPRQSHRPSCAETQREISRVLAAKCALAIRVDALGEPSEATIGVESREKVEARLRQLE